MALVHKGETVIKAAAGAQLSEAGLRAQQIGHQFNNPAHYNAAGKYYEVLGRNSAGVVGMFHLYGDKTVFIAGGTYAAESAVIPTPGGGGDAGFAEAVDTTPYSQEDIDALNGTISDLNGTITELTAAVVLSNEKADLALQQAADYLRRTNVSEKNYDALAAAVSAAASKGIGGSVGLGFISGKTFAGGGVHY
jgi:hypothetical protein